MIFDIYLQEKTQIGYESRQSVTVLILFPGGQKGLMIFPQKPKSEFFHEGEK